MPLTKSELFTNIDAEIGEGLDLLGSELNVILKDSYESLEAADVAEAAAREAADDLESAARIAADSAEATARQENDEYYDGLRAAHVANTSNPHSVTKSQVGLGNADNTSDANKPISSAEAVVNAINLANAEADAIQLLRLHNPDLVWSGFVNTSTSTPAHTANKAYIATASGTVLGITAVKGQVIKDNGTVFIAETFNTKVVDIARLGINYFKNNRFTNLPVIYGQFDTKNALLEHFDFYPTVSASELIDAMPVFGYIGKALQITFVNSDQAIINIPKSQYYQDEKYLRGDNYINFNVEVYSPAAQNISLWLVSKKGAVDTTVTTKSISLVTGINIINIRGIIPTDSDNCYIRKFDSQNNWDNQVVKFGRIHVFGGFNNNTLDSLDISEVKEITNEYISNYDESVNKIQANFFRNNRYASDILLNITGASGVYSVPHFSFFTPTSLTFEDAAIVFGYFGRTLKLITNGLNTNYFFFIPKDNFVNDENFIIDRNVFANLEINSEISKQIDFVLMSKVGATWTTVTTKRITLNIGINKINISGIMPEMTGAEDGLVLRFFSVVSTDWLNQTIHFGRLNIFSGINSSALDFVENYSEITEKYIETKIDTYRQSNWFGKKIVTIGDSITAQQTWQPEIVRRIGVVYNGTETTSGTGGHAVMGEGGSMITPYITGLTGQTAGKSIYYRADDVDFYDPDLIILYGGQNDTWTNIGTISDTPYSGPEVSSDPPTFHASYMGVIEKLCTQNPLATVICVAPGWSADQTASQKLLKVNAIKDCAEKYGLRFINLYTELGINSINRTSFISDGVHPNAAGGLLIGTLISNYLI